MFVILLLFGQTDLTIPIGVKDYTIIYWADKTLSVREGLVNPNEQIDDEEKILVPEETKRSRHNIPLLRGNKLIIPLHLFKDRYWTFDIEKGKIHAIEPRSVYKGRKALKETR